VSGSEDKLGWILSAYYFNDAYNTLLLVAVLQDIFDASARCLGANEEWTVILIDSNLTDKSYLVIGVQGTAFQSFEG